MPAQVWSDFIFQFFFIVISYHDLFLSYFLPWRQSPTPRREKGGGRREKGLISYSTFYVLRWNVECRIGSLLPLHDAWEIGKAESCILFSPMAPRLPCLVTFASPPMRHKAPNARGWPEGAESWPTPEPRLASCLGHAPIWGRIGTHSMHTVSWRREPLGGRHTAYRIAYTACLGKYGEIRTRWHSLFRERQLLFD